LVEQERNNELCTYKFVKDTQGNWTPLLCDSDNTNYPRTLASSYI